MMHVSRQDQLALDANRIGRQSPACARRGKGDRGGLVIDIRGFRSLYAKHMTERWRRIGLLGLMLVTVSRLACADDGRFVRLDGNGQPLPKTAREQTWPCVLDRHSGLIWEVKTRRPGLHQRDRLFSWRQTSPRHTGGVATDDAGCDAAPCTAQALVQAVNRQGWCGAHGWRLPEREELRSLVDYGIPYPGPTLNTRYFPNTRRQFYWSATPSANEADEAWGIGFAFGFDYAYPKDNRVHVRLVRDAPP
ncbi:MAG TPA: DUF1566 domain-containing protein [Gammaproteobacteria bacterium]|nr:DUF1566 domain-containing protein [Gammaproteobacteria bacterium]